MKTTHHKTELDKVLHLKAGPLKATEGTELLPGLAITITADDINQKAVSLSGVANLLVKTAREMIITAIELGEMLEAKKLEVDSTAPGTWVKWAIENLTFTVESSRQYRKLYQNKALVMDAMDRNQIDSIRAALALLRHEEKKVEDAKQPQLELNDQVKTKLSSAFDRVWALISDPGSLEKEDQKDFTVNTATLVRTCLENKWELPGFKVEAVE